MKIKTSVKTEIGLSGIRIIMNNSIQLNGGQLDRPQWNELSAFGLVQSARKRESEFRKDHKRKINMPIWLVRKLALEHITQTMLTPHTLTKDGKSNLTIRHLGIKHTSTRKKLLHEIDSISTGGKSNNNFLFPIPAKCFSNLVTYLCRRCFFSSINFLWYRYKGLTVNCCSFLHLKGGSVYCWFTTL